MPPKSHNNQIQFISIPTKDANHFWNGGMDIYGNPPEHVLSDGEGNPCRHCQQDIRKGDPMLILSYMPFETQHAYAETGPIFLHANPCERYPETHKIPPMFLERESYLVKGYTKGERIYYGSGKIISPDKINAYAETLFENPEIDYLHIRSATNNCFSCRIDRNK